MSDETKPEETPANTVVDTEEKLREFIREQAFTHYRANRPHVAAMPTPSDMMDALLAGITPVLFDVGKRVQELETHLNELSRIVRATARAYPVFREDMQ